MDTGTPDFFVESAQLELDVSAEISSLNASVNIGFLEASIIGGNIAMGGGLTVTLIDPTPADSRISVTDLGADL